MQIMQVYWIIDGINNVSYLGMICSWYYENTKEILIWLLKKYDLWDYCSVINTYMFVIKKTESKYSEANFFKQP